jgi:major membrane immunogen (membrane-anchored lipoprotein)
LSALTRLRLPILFIVGLAFAVLLAFAVFSTTGAAHQDDAAVKQTEVAAKDGTDAGGKEVTTENHAWSSYHWAIKSTPLRLTLDDNVSQTNPSNPVTNWDTYLTRASSDWSQSSVLDTSVLANQSNASCTPTAGKVEVCNKDYGATGWSGLAQIWITKGRYKHITQGLAKMNDRYFGSNDAAKRAHVMCQEVGHTFGLGHTSEDGSSQQTCMDYSTDSTNSQHPNAHDYEELELIYSHLHSTSTSASKLPAAAKRGNYDTRDKWGQLKHRDADGKHAVYERQFSDGTLLVTFVEVEDEEILEGQEDQPQEKQQKQEKSQDQPQEEEEK